MSSQAKTPAADRDKSILFTIGHSSRSLEDFVALLHDNRIECVVDVRSLPGSRAFPHFNAENLAVSLSEAGIEHVHAKALGGRRKRSLPKEDMRNAMWRNDSFRKYADYALTPAFAEALAWLETLAARQRCALMCAEAVWWRCHRRIIADHLLAHGHRVLHIMGRGKLTPASLTPGARGVDGVVTYPPPAEARDADAGN